MKYLNRIIFVNSANISYAEISVDGNVHFTGTQGVGKSTILRALLFFYNADKHRLGIQQGQKSFDEFYFRQSDSHILYEVMRDNEAFTVLVSRYQGRATWRFIDAPYQKEWLIDSTGRVMSDWVKIRERINHHIAVSARIDSGAMFKDIIFGNTHDHKYTKFALVQSAHYQNIPRSIQNVFLNTKLDADFIKNTIIQSMAEEDIPVDLQTYRRQVTDFEREYDEIDCWFRQAKDGTYPIRTQAQKIAEQGRTIIALNQQIIDVWQKLNYAVNESEKQLPLIEDALNKTRNSINEEKTRERELSDEYNNEKDNFNQQLGAKKEKLKEITQKHTYFEKNLIHEKLLLASREPMLKQERDEKRNLLNDLLKTNNSIEEKYKIARDKLENARKDFVLCQKDELNRKREELQTKREAYDNNRSINRNQITNEYNDWRNNSDNRLKQLIEEQHIADKALRDLKQWHPKAKEAQQISEELQSLVMLKSENDANQKVVDNTIETLQNEYKMSIDNLKASNEKKLEKLDSEKLQLRERINKIDKLLSHLKGSLYEWLTQNKNGWEDTIGKVVDEERILYAQGLDPTFSTSTEDLFGINLNLENVISTNRTPDELLREKQLLEEQLQDIIKQLNQLPITLKNDSQKLEKKFSERIKPLREERTRLKVECDQIPTKRQTLENQKHAIEMEEQELISEEKAKRQRAFNDALLQVKAEQDSCKKQENKMLKDLKELDTIFQKQIKQDQALFEEFRQEQFQKAESRNKEYDKQFQELDRQQKAELAGKGVDINLLTQYKETLGNIDSLLTQIENERQFIIEYNIAKRELFAIEPTIHKEITDTEQKLRQIRQMFEDKRLSFEKKRIELEKEANRQQKELKHRQDGLSLYRQMVENEHLVSEAILHNDKKTVTHYDCQELITQLRGTVNHKREEMETLKQVVVNFNRNFKPQNAFHFNTMPVVDSDYIQIAANLQDFLDYNKIEEYRKRTSEHYKDILGRISVEIGELMKRRSDVDKVILDINRDFVEKNFAGVIKSIELQATATSDKLMQLLISIQSYTEENALSMGKLNLFSQDDHEDVNRQVIGYLKSLTNQLQDEPQRKAISLSDSFRLQFRVKENDNDTGWVERINNVGSDGTDILVKAMVNIMLINVFKKKAARKSGDFIVHCMMDEIGRLHPNNIKGILQFANSRNIYLINSSPTSYNPYDYKYTYLLSKHNVKTRVEKLLKRNMQ